MASASGGIGGSPRRRRGACLGRIRDRLGSAALPAGANALRTVSRFGGARGWSRSPRWAIRTWSAPIPAGLRRPGRWDRGAPRWARRMYSRSLLVLHGLVDRRTGAVVAGAREGWAYVWPRDASAVAIALAAAGYRDEARRIVSFLRRLDLGAAARFQPDGTPVEGRGAQGDAAGWIAAAAAGGGLPSATPCGRGADRPTTRRAAAAISSPTRSRRAHRALRALFGTPAGTTGAPGRRPRLGPRLRRGLGGAALSPPRRSIRSSAAPCCDWLPSSGRFGIVSLRKLGRRRRSLDRAHRLDGLEPRRARRARAPPCA